MLSFQKIMKTKIAKFLLPFLFSLIFSCSSDNEVFHPVPTIRFGVSVSIISTPNLQSLGTPAYFGSASGERLGYNGHGIYVVQSGQNTYRAFDASCTYVSSTENHVEIEKHLTFSEDNPAIVECSVCKSQFELLNGTGVKGPAQYELREYQTQTNGTTLRIFN